MANINKIRLSGQTYNIEDLNAPKTVELTQAQYDALSTKDPNTFYIITDAEGADLSNYYTKSETSGATEISTALNAKADTATTYTKTEVDNAITAATSTKQDTLVSGTNIKTLNNESILGSGNITIEGGGGGKAIEAGRGISITTGETADTVSFNLPISAGTGTNSVKENSANLASGTNSHAEGDYTTASGARSHAEGASTEATANNSHAEGASTHAQGDSSHAEGYSTYAIGSRAHSEGYNTTASTNFSHAEGSYTKTTNQSEHASGQYNNSVSASTTFGDSGNTLFSVGNGTSNSARHNAFEIRQNGDIYITSGGTDIKLQDNLGGGGGTSYSAGTGIDITNDVISVTGKVDTSAITTSVTSSSTDSQVPSAKAVNDKLGGLSLVKLTQAEYDAIVTKDNSTLYVIVN